VRTNLIYNPSFEVDTSNTTLENNSSGSPTLSQDTTTGQSGSSSAKVVIPTLAETENWRVKLRLNDSNRFSIVGGVTYYCSIYVKTAAARAFQLAMEEIGGGSGYYGATETSTTGFVRYSLTFTAVANKTMTFNLLLNDNGVAGTIWIDAALVEVSSTLQGYFDGSTVATNHAYAWNSTAHNSPSIETGTNFSNVSKNSGTITPASKSSTSWTGPTKSSESITPTNLHTTSCSNVSKNSGTIIPTTKS